jgi:hypothetical protein
MAKGILMPVVEFTGIAEDEFHDWYDTEPIPERQRAPGFLSWERWVGVHNPNISSRLNELESFDVLKSAAYQAIGDHGAGSNNLSVWSKRVTARIKILMRFEGDQILPGDRSAPRDAPAVLLNAMNVAPAQ